MKKEDLKFKFIIPLNKLDRGECGLPCYLFTDKRSIPYLDQNGIQRDGYNSLWAKEAHLLELIQNDEYWNKVQEVIETNRKNYPSTYTDSEIAILSLEQELLPDSCGNYSHDQFVDWYISQAPVNPDTDEVREHAGYPM